jgi:hypothetical protein
LFLVAHPISLAPSKIWDILLCARRWKNAPLSDEIMTVREMAVILKVTERTIFRLEAEGKITLVQGWRLIAVSPL